MDVFPDPFDPRAEEEWKLDLAPLLQDGEVAVDATLLPGPAAVFAGLSLTGQALADGGTALVFTPGVAPAEREHARFARYGVRLPLLLAFETSSAPPRKCVEEVWLKVRRG